MGVIRSGVWWWFTDRVLRLWECGDCGLMNSRKYDWCQDPSCRAKVSGRG